MKKAKQWIEQLLKKPASVFIMNWLERAGRHRISTHAAALTYYTLFAVVPLLFFAICVGSLFIDTNELAAVALDALESLLPSGAESIRENVQDLLRYRGSVGMVAALVALWSASGMFTVLEGAVNVVWERPFARAYWKRRLMGILALFGATMWLLVAFMVRTLGHLLSHWLPILESLNFPLSRWSERGISLLAVFLLNLSVFRFFPASKVCRRTAVIVATGVSVVWVLTREAFAWALTAGILNYPLLYGSLWGVIVPIVWANVSYQIMLYGAELQAYIEALRLAQFKETYARSALVVPAATPATPAPEIMVER
ncbi:MAG: YihY/virulence factor BrkB family protein [Anaerolineae bacterium]|nr:YihY/virulence factor BrkB family protein [Anaerolineae bacterium]